ncbi:hypothetical protein ABC383_24530 [Noviherbaspirillum sp. 1P10PC]|uniref:hypothetical protein n=1 Tax=Noviherbaspirillum sp. 1P10PC TaxID=3132292 RepID=UPI0039A19F38
MNQRQGAIALPDKVVIAGKKIEQLRNAQSADAFVHLVQLFQHCLGMRNPSGRCRPAGVGLVHHEDHERNRQRCEGHAQARKDSENRHDLWSLHQTGNFAAGALQNIHRKMSMHRNPTEAVLFHVLMSAAESYAAPDGKAYFSRRSVSFHLHPLDLRFYINDDYWFNSFGHGIMALRLLSVMAFPSGRRATLPGVSRHARR